jgi:S1-C subfamily serine protease
MMIWGEFKNDVADNETYQGDIYWAGSYTYTSAKGYDRTIRSFASSLDDAVAIWEYRLSPSEKGRTSKLTKEVLSSSGSGFAVTSIGHVITNAHVVDGAQKISVRIGDKLVAAKLVAIDQQNDLAVLKVDGTTLPLKIGETDSVRLGDEITVGGFPNPEMQGTSLKLTRGVISGMKGAHDDVRHYQIDAAIQPGNSGGPLLSAGRSVVGVVNARLNDSAVVLATGSIPQNVNYAIKTDYLIPLIRGVDGLAEQIARETYPQELSIGECLERSAYQVICDLSPE